MPYKDLKDFIKRLEKEGELIRIKEELSPILEITEVTDRVCKLPGGGKALLFERPKDYSIPVLTNLLGSEKRIKLALGYENLEDIGWKLYKLLRPEIPHTFLDKLKRLPELKKLNDSLPKIVKDGPIRENVKKDGIDLFEFPILQCWPEDGGRYITFGQVITKDPESGIRNVGLYRLQVLSSTELAMHWQIHKDGNHHYWKAKRLKKKLDVAIVIGGDPVLSYVASAPLPPEVDEYLFAGLIREDGVELIKGITVDLEYPAHAEIVIEGYVDPEEPLIDEGPFGDHTGFYTPVDKYPKMHVTAVLYRNNSIYLTTIVGRPPQEDKYIGWATERIFLPLIKFNLPEVVDYHLPAEGCFHNFCFVSIKKRYPGHAFKVAYGLLGLGLMSLTKHIVVFDEGIDVHDFGQVLWAWGNNVDPSRDVLILKGPIDVLDHSTNQVGFGGNDLYRMDCSAFVKRVFEVNGISLPRSTKEQAQVGVQVGLEDIKPGDLLFFSTYRPGPSHVGIYIGNGKMIHASEKKGITIDRIEDPYWQKRFLFAKRVTKDNYVVKTYQKEEMQKNRDEIADLIFILSNR